MRLQICFCVSHAFSVYPLLMVNPFFLQFLLTFIYVELYCMCMLSDVAVYQFRSSRKQQLKSFVFGSISILIFFSVISLTFTIGYFTRILIHVSRGNDSLPKPDIIHTIKFGVKPLIVAVFSFIATAGVFFFFSGIVLSLAVPSNIGVNDTVILSLLFGSGGIVIVFILHLIPVSLFYYVQSQSIGAFFDVNRFYNYLQRSPIRCSAGYSLLSFILLASCAVVSISIIPHLIVCLPFLAFYHLTIVAYIYGYYFGDSFGTRVSASVSIPETVADKIK